MNTSLVTVVTNAEIKYKINIVHYLIQIHLLCFMKTVQEFPVGEKLPLDTEGLPNQHLLVESSGKTANAGIEFK